MLRAVLNSRVTHLCMAVVLLPACANTIHPPEPPSDVRKMYLLDLGRHTRLAFGLPDGEFVEYGYGEWKWYANLEDQWWRVPAVLLWPTQGTLGRREWRGAGAEDRFLQEYDGLPVLELPAERHKVVALVAELDRAFEQGSDQLVRNRVYRLDFVPHDRSYWAFNNSNHAVKEWLQEAGYEVRGAGIFANWKLEQ